MDHISSLECLKLDSKSEVLDKDSGENDLFLSAMVPLNYDTPIIGSKVAESEAAELEADASDTDDWDSEELIIGSNADEFEDDEFEADESEADESEDDEFEAEDEFEADDEFEDDEFEADESETDDSDSEKLIGRECQFCLKVGDHFSQTCSYRYHVPKNAIVGKRCVVVCNLCGCLFRDSCCGVCGQSDGCAILMNCLHCGKIGEHLIFTCPSREGKPSCFSLDPYTGSVISI